MENLKMILDKGNIELITLGVRCKACGRTWGIRLNGVIDLEQLPLSGFVCGPCTVNRSKQTEKSFVIQNS
jgi:hypothetical protein